MNYRGKVKFMNGIKYEDPSTRLVCDTFAEWVVYLKLTDIFRGDYPTAILITCKDGTSYYMYAEPGTSFYEELGNQNAFRIIKDLGVRWVYLYDILFHDEAIRPYRSLSPVYEDLRNWGLTGIDSQKSFNTLFCSGPVGIDSLIHSDAVEYLGDTNKYAIGGCSDIYDRYAILRYCRELPVEFHWGAISEYVLSINGELIRSRNYHIQYEFGNNRLDTILYVLK